MQEKAKEPEIRFAGFTGAWEQRKLNEIADVYDGVHQTPKYTSSGVRFLSVENIATLESEKYISEADFIRDFKIFPQKGDILMTRIGDIGTAKVIKSDEKYAFYVSLALLKPKHINSDFLCNSIASKNFQKGLKARSLLTAIPLKINKEEIGKVATSFPLNLSEQEKIGSFFNHIESLLTLHQRKYEKLLNIKKSMLEKMFPKEGEVVPEIRFKGFTGAWEQRKLGNLGETYTGLSGKSKEDFGHGTAKFITYMNVYSNPVSDPEGTDLIEVDNRQNTVRKGDVLFTTSSETPEEVGMSSVVFESIENTYLNSFCFGYRPKIEFNNFYLAFLLRSGGFRKNIIFLAQGISRYNISKNAVMNIPIPIPAKEEQEAIGDFFKHLDALLTLHQRKLEMLKNVKQAFLEKMFV